MSQQRAAVRTGQCLKGRYYIEKLLGEGGMGQVFLCHDTVRQGRYALKVIHPHLASLEEVRRRFVQELKVTERLTHPGIIRTYNLEHEPLLFFIMEYVEGRTLEEILQDAMETHRKPPITLLQAARLLKELCGILTYAHSQGVIHRDIKPPNVMITIEGRVKLMDFGIAKIMDDTPEVKHTGFQGTVYYMAPEQLQGGGPVTPSADVFSLGIMAYQLLTGEMPIGAVAPPSFYSANLSLPVDSAVLRAIAPHPDKRHPTPHAFWTALADALEPIITSEERASLQAFQHPGQDPDLYIPEDSSDDLLAPLHELPPHPTLESARSLSAMLEDGRHEWRTDIKVPMERGIQPSYGVGLPQSNDGSGESEELTHAELPLTAQTSLPRSNERLRKESSYDNLPEMLDEYPVVRRGSAAQGRGGAGSSPPEETTDMEVPQARSSPLEEDASPASVVSSLGFPFPSLDSLEPVAGNREQSKETAQHPMVRQRGEDETAVDIATVRTYRTSGSFPARRGTPLADASSGSSHRLGASSPLSSSDLTSNPAVSRPRPLHSALDPSLFSSTEEDEIIALDKNQSDASAVSPRPLRSGSQGPLSSQDDLDALSSMSRGGGGSPSGTGIVRTLPPESPFSAVSLPELPPFLESKLLYSRQDEPLLEFVKIPVGTFLMGSSPDDPLHCDNELPQRQVHLDGYWIARTPITNRVWSIFVEESHYICGEADYLQHWGGNTPPASVLEHPVVYVSVEDVKRFCAFYGLHLPTEAQWERAARGDHGLAWPWGNTPPTPELCNFFDSELDTTTPVGTYPKGASPYGLLDCSGNVWEWCSDSWDREWLQKMGDEPLNPIHQLDAAGSPVLRRSVRTQYAIRGGCYLYRAGGVRCAFRYKSSKRAPYIGARVVMAAR